MIKEKLFKKTAYDFDGSPYSIYKVYWDDLLLGTKKVPYKYGEDITNIVNTPYCLDREISRLTSMTKDMGITTAPDSYGYNYNEYLYDPTKLKHVLSVYFDTKADHTESGPQWTFAERLAEMIKRGRELALKARKCVNLQCMSRYSFKGDGNIDQEMFCKRYASDPYIVVDHYNKEVSLCHGYYGRTAYLKKVAKRYGYKADILED